METQYPRDLLRTAKRMVWFKTPEETLSDPVFFLAHVMTYGVSEDIKTAQKYFAPDDFRRALKNAPAGVFDIRSWAYWNTVFGRVPVPPMPRRKFFEEQGRG